MQWEKFYHNSTCQLTKVYSKLIMLVTHQLLYPHILQLELVQYATSLYCDLQISNMQVSSNKCDILSCVFAKQIHAWHGNNISLHPWSHVYFKHTSTVFVIITVHVYSGTVIFIGKLVSWFVEVPSALGPITVITVTTFLCLVNNPIMSTTFKDMLWGLTTCKWLKYKQ